MHIAGKISLFKTRRYFLQQAVNLFSAFRVEVLMEVGLVCQAIVSGTATEVAVTLSSTKGKCLNTEHIIKEIDKVDFTTPKKI